jgi:hypothetical protein
MLGIICNRLGLRRLRVRSAPAWRTKAPEGMVVPDRNRCRFEPSYSIPNDVALPLRGKHSRAELLVGRSGLAGAGLA